MKHCKNCGNPMQDDLRFCQKCGAADDEAAIPKQAEQTSVPSNESKRRKKRMKILILIALIALAAIAAVIAVCIGSSQNKATGKSGKTIASIGKEGKTDAPAETAETTAQPIPAETSYTLESGIYTAGIDIPCGWCNVTAVSGTGNLISSNLFSGGVNEMFGIDNGYGLYTDTFNGLSLPSGTTLSVSSTLIVQLEYTQVDSGFTGRAYSEDDAITLKTGNYIAGVDFDAGVYKLVAVSGTGTLSSSNILNGGVNEMFGIDDGQGLYTPVFYNAELPEGTELSVSGGVSVKLIRADENG